MKGKRCLGVLLAAGIALSAGSLTAFAHHGGRGYNYAYSHTHNQACYATQTNCVHAHDSWECGFACEHVCSEENGCITRALNCHYYAPAQQGTSHHGQHCCW
ncbi:MAG: hypothetical protein HFG20_09860 [Anaerotruncus sp.]|nr:hypothetical protein [Anaerotruncus sp.]